MVEILGLLQVVVDLLRKAIVFVYLVINEAWTLELNTSNCVLFVPHFQKLVLSL